MTVQPFPSRTLNDVDSSMHAAPVLNKDEMISNKDDLMCP
jgi:hypothetical protein